MAAKKKSSSESAGIDPILNSPEMAMNMLYKAEEKSMAELFENEDQEEKDLNAIANAATKKEVEELMSLKPVKIPKPKKKK